MFLRSIARHICASKLHSCRLIAALLISVVQLMYGNSRGEYVCIGHYRACGVDPVAASCTVCETLRLTNDGNCSAPSSGYRTTVRFGSNQQDSSIQRALPARSSTQRCGCTQLPVMLAFQRALRTTRDSLSSELREAARALVAQSAIDPLFHPKAPRCASDPSVRSSTSPSALAGIMTVVIRC